MKFSREWLSDYIDLKGLSDDDLADRFTNIGHAIEAVEKHGNDTIFDLEVTTNRVDAMSHRGMARELAAALARPSPGASRTADRDPSPRVRGEGRVRGS
jgi:phenylalanyl-tRNA synthetase beta chain